MTRATLLRLLAHPTALNGADVRALEELAEAFPYCQTAHLLLAKAAHDQGSMLAGQRLRRAATYAADRTLLRELIEAAPIEELAEAGAAAPSAALEYTDYQAPAFGATGFSASSDAQLPAREPAPAPTEALLADQPAPEITPAPALATEEALPVATAPATALLAPAPTLVAADSLAAAVLPEATPTAETESEVPSPLPAELAPIPEPVAEPAEAERTPLLLAPEPEQPAESFVASEPLGPASLTSPAELVSEPAEAAVISNWATEPLAEEVATSARDATPEESLAEERPPQAPPIRPPAEAEVARHEFGLAPEEPAEITAYQLPELELAITIPLTLAAATPRLPPFSGVADVAYAPSEGSRLGYCLVPTAAGLLSEGDAPLIPAAALPPTGEFFAPDALVLAHVATQPPPVTSSATDLIDSFLLRSPSGTRRRAQPPAKTGEQTDLSVRSTRAAPDLASESLAKILTQQGKVEQAIAIYERLMVKTPEKMAYFAAQIDLLRP